MAALRIGIVGYGISSRLFHLPFILANPDLEVHAFLQRAAPPPNAKCAIPGEHCSVDYPDAKHYRTFDDFIADPGLDLVVICSHPDTHAPFVEGALHAGKHVVVEKPLTVTTAEADRLIDVAQRTGNLLACFQNRRYDSDFLTLKSVISQNDLGTVTEFENCLDVHNLARTRLWDSKLHLPGAGMLYATGSHTIDQTLSLFGLPSSVTAFTKVLRKGGCKDGAEDSFTIILQYDGSPLVSTIKTTVVNPLPPAQRVRFRVRGTKGAFTKNGQDTQIEQVIKGVHVEDPTFGHEPADFQAHVTLRDQEACFEDPDGSVVTFDSQVRSEKGCYVEFYRNLAAAIRGKEELAQSVGGARNVVRLIELAKESAGKQMTVPWS